MICYNSLVIDYLDPSHRIYTSELLHPQWVPGKFQTQQCSSWKCTVSLSASPIDFLVLFIGIAGFLDQFSLSLCLNWRKVNSGHCSRTKNKRFPYYRSSHLPFDRAKMKIPLDETTKGLWSSHSGEKASMHFHVIRWSDVVYAAKWRSELVAFDSWPLKIPHLLGVGSNALSYDWVVR